MLSFYFFYLYFSILKRENFLVRKIMLTEKQDYKCIFKDGKIIIKCINVHFDSVAKPESNNSRKYCNTKEKFRDLKNVK